VPDGRCLGATNGPMVRHVSQGKFEAAQSRRPGTDGHSRDVRIPHFPWGLIQYPYLGGAGHDIT
jgi:hypothetical protein